MARSDTRTKKRAAAPHVKDDDRRKRERLDRSTARANPPEQHRATVRRQAQLKSKDAASAGAAAAPAAAAAAEADAGRSAPRSRERAARALAAMTHIFNDDKRYPSPPATLGVLWSRTGDYYATS